MNKSPVKAKFHMEIGKVLGYHLPQIPTGWDELLHFMLAPLILCFFDCLTRYSKFLDYLYVFNKQWRIWAFSDIRNILIALFACYIIFTFSLTKVKSVMLIHSQNTPYHTAKIIMTMHIVSMKVITYKLHHYIGYNRLTPKWLFAYNHE